MILDNPFHVIGLPADCTAREKARRESQLKAYLKFGKRLTFDGDDLFFEGCRRNQATVERSLSALHDANDRIGYGLFWFTRSGLLDDHALPLVRRQDLRGAFRIWERIEGRLPTRQYASSLNNFGTLCLLIGIKARSGWPRDISVRTEYILRGLRAKATIVGSLSGQDLSSFCTTFTDDVAARNPEDIAVAFGGALDEFVAEADKYGIELDNSELIRALETGGARTAPLKSKYALAAREKLDRAVKACAAEFADDESRAAKAGTVLMEAAREQLPELATVVATTDIAYTSLADRAADQLLDAAVANFNYHANAETMSLEVVQASASLVRYASEIACGVVVRKRAQDNLETVREIERDQRRAHVMEGARDALRAWIERSGILLEEDPLPTNQVEFVRHAISNSPSGHGSAIVLLEFLRQQGTRVFGPDFRNSEELVFMSSVVCNMLVAHAVSAYNRSSGVTEKHAAELLPRIAEHFTEASVASDAPPGAFPVSDECFERMMRNVGLALGDLRQRSKANTGGGGCLVILLSLVGIGLVGGVLEAVFAGSEPTPTAQDNGGFSPARRQVPNRPSTAPAAVPARQEPSTRSTAPASAPATQKLSFEMPPPGMDLVLSMPQLRWCVREARRIEIARDITTQTEVDVDVVINRVVNRYNARCGSFRYRQGDLERARRNVGGR